MLRIAETASLTLKVLKEVGWCKGKFAKTNKSGKVVGYCLVGALEATGCSVIEGARLQKYLESKTGTGNLIRWNDRRATTKEDVFKLLRSACQVRGK